MQLAIFVTLVFSAIVSLWMCITTSKRIANERIIFIEKEVKALGGNIIGSELVKRTTCPFNDEYKDLELTYKFYKVKYTLDDKLKEGWAILAMKQNWYGPNGAIVSKWMWRL